MSDLNVRLRETVPQRRGPLRDVIEAPRQVSLRMQLSGLSRNSDVDLASTFVRFLHKQSFNRESGRSDDVVGS